ncbi:MAG TPA: ATP-binding protein [Thermoleophilaceae bacterium]
MRIPDRYRELLAGSPVEAPTLAFVSAIAETLEDNKTPFFPAYTDHGVHHVEHVLETAVRLTPCEAWAVLEPSDAAAIICATALHDIAMHLREPHFVALVTSGPTPRPWFAEPRPGRAEDRPWPELWLAFQAECRRMGSGSIEAILGPDNRGVPAAVYESHPDPLNWTLADRLFVGEFIRRHHARAAHEIALHGWPGLAHSAFPNLFKLMPDLADAAGLIARSHSEDLRTIVDYCEHVHRGNFRPWGVLVPFAMSLLRVADYLQIDAGRAPPVLLHLKAPLSQTSLDEWNKHAAVARVGWDGKDPAAVYVTAGEDLTLRTYLQVLELLRAVQFEMDVTSAILSETYSDERFRVLTLARRRIVANLSERAVTERLPFAPLEARLRTDPDLFRLVVRPLYGDRPSIAVRELVQNAVDAVRELHRHRGTTAQGPEPDVIVELEELPDERAVLRVTDHGIGMTPETVSTYYLAAGASLGPNPEDFETVAPSQAFAWLKAGRFGIGVFAAFLLGDKISVRTKHADSAKAVEFVVANNAEIVELRWCDGPVGTTVEIPFERARLDDAHSVADRSWGGVLLHFVRHFVEYYRGSTPKAVLRLNSSGIDEAIEELRGLRISHMFDFDFPADVPSPLGELPDDWTAVRVPDFDGIVWRRPSGFSAAGSSIVHNGFQLGGYWFWTDDRLKALVQEPAVAIADSRHKLNFDLTRSEVLGDSLPFEYEILASISEDLCHWSTENPLQEYPLLEGWARAFAVGSGGWLPFIPQVVSTTGASRLYVLWDEDWREMPAWQDRFTAEQDRHPWPDDELRLVLPLDIREGVPNEGVTYGFGDYAEPQDRMYAGVVSQSVRRLEWLTGWRSLGTVVRAWGTTHAGFTYKHDGAPGWSRDYGYRPGARPERQYVYRGSFSRISPQVKASLSARMHGLTRGGGGIAALTVFKLGPVTPAYGTELGAVWAKRINGLVANDASTAALHKARQQAARERRRPRKSRR